MTKSLDSSEQLSAPDAKVLDDIRRVGWHTLGVSPSPGENGPHWAFSIGLHNTFAHPEVIVMGLPVKTCQELVNVIGMHVKEGTRYDADHDYAEILKDPFRCAFKQVRRSHYTEHVGYAIWFYENDEFPLLQCFCQINNSDSLGMRAVTSTSEHSSELSTFLDSRVTA